MAEEKDKTDSRPTVVYDELRLVHPDELCMYPPLTIRDVGDGEPWHFIVNDFKAERDSDDPPQTSSGEPD